MRKKHTRSWKSRRRLSAKKQRRLAVTRSQLEKKVPIATKLRNIVNNKNVRMETIFSVLDMLKKQLFMSPKEESVSWVRYFFDKLKSGHIPIDWSFEYEGVPLLTLVLEIAKFCKNTNKGYYFLLILQDIPSTFYWNKAMARQFFQYAKQYIKITQVNNLVETIIISSNQMLMRYCLFYFNCDVSMLKMDLARLLRLQCNRLLYSIKHLLPLIWHEPYFIRLVLEQLPYIYSATEYMMLLQSCFSRLELVLPKDIVQHKISLFLTSDKGLDCEKIAVRMVADKCISENTGVNSDNVVVI